MDDNKIPTIFLTGVISSGKSSFINSFAGSFISNVSLQRETLQPLLYKFSKKGLIDNLYNISEKLKDKHEETINKRNEKKFNDNMDIIQMNDEDLPLYLDTETLNIIDFPGLNDADDNSDTFFKLIEKNIQIADLIIFITDAKNTFESKCELDNFNKIKNLVDSEIKKGHYLNLIVVVNKFDDDNEDLHDMFERAKSKINCNIFKFSSHKYFVDSIIKNKLTTKINGIIKKEFMTILKNANVNIDKKLIRYIKKFKKLKYNKLHYIENNDINDDNTEEINDDENEIDETYTEENNKKILSIYENCKIHNYIKGDWDGLFNHIIKFKSGLYDNIFNTLETKFDNICCECISKFTEFRNLTNKQYVYPNTLAKEQEKYDTVFFELLKSIEYIYYTYKEKIINYNDYFDHRIINMIKTIMDIGNEKLNKSEVKYHLFVFSLIHWIIYLDNSKLLNNAIEAILNYCGVSLCNLLFLFKIIIVYASTRIENKILFRFFKWIFSSEIYNKTFKIIPKLFSIKLNKLYNPIFININCVCPKMEENGIILKNNYINNVSSYVYDIIQILSGKSQQNNFILLRDMILYSIYPLKILKMINYKQKINFNDDKLNDEFDYYLLNEKNENNILYEKLFKLASYLGEDYKNYKELLEIINTKNINQKNIDDERFVIRKHPFQFNRERKAKEIFIEKMKKKKCEEKLEESENNDDDEFYNNELSDNELSKTNVREILKNITKKYCERNKK